MPSTEYIGTVNTEGGHYYIGPGSLNGLIEEAKEDIETGTGEFSVSSIYILECSDEYPCGNADKDPVWMWNKG